MTRPWILAALVLVPLLGILPALADTTSETAPKTTKAVKVELPAYTAEREAAALTFVRTHHAELADLLSRLKRHDRVEYEKAIRELFRTSERLAQWQEKNPAKYETELRNWKLNSRIQVLMARLSMTTDPAVEKELRAAVTEQIELRRQQLQSERERTATRLAEIDAELQKDMNMSVDQRLDQLMQGTKERKKQRDTSAKKSK